MKRLSGGLTTTSTCVLTWAFFATLILAIIGNPARAQILYAVDLDSQNLYKVSTANAALTLVGNTGVSLGSLEYRPSNGLLYGFTSGSGSTLYKINPANAFATAVGSLGGEFVFEGGLVIAPDGTVYATNKSSAGTPTLFKINLDTGATTNVGIISGGNHDINGLAWRSDNMLVGLDRETNSLLAINPSTAASSVITAVSPTIGGVGGMATIGDSGFFATAGPGGSIPGSNQLYSVNILTGAHALVGSFAPTVTTGNGISGLALIPVPEPSAIVLAASALVSWFGIRRHRVA